MKKLIYVCMTIVLLLMQCSIHESAYDSGRLTVVFADSKSEGTGLGKAATVLSQIEVRLTHSGMDTMRTLYEPTNGYFDVKIFNLEDGDDYQLLIKGWEGSSTPIVRAVADSIEIMSEEETVVTMQWKSFRPTPLQPHTEWSISENGNPTFVWSQVDGAVKYYLKIGTDRLFANGSVLDATLCGDTTVTVNTLTVGNVYYWKLACEDAEGMRSPWIDKENILGFRLVE